jgi:hypothetical protein
MIQATQRPIRFVIVASPKSGTTWMQKLIGAHKDLHCGESRLFGRYFDPTNPTGPHVTVEQTVNHLSRHLGLDHIDEQVCKELTFDIADAIAKRCANSAGATVYGEKFTPYPGTAEHAADMLAEYDRGLRVVHLVRDGRDVIVSGAAHRLNIARQRWASGQAGSASDDLEAAQQLDDRVIPDVWFQHFLENWIDVNTAMLEAVPMFESVLRLQYEELLGDTESQATKLLRHIADGSGVGVTPGQAKACVEAASFRNLTGGRDLGEEDRASFFRKGAAGDWKNWFTIDQMHEFDERAGELLEALGYDRGIAEQAA